MLVTQQKMIMSNYLELYKILIEKDNILRQIKEMIDFSFVYDELKDKYCDDNGRPAYDPIMMFKYLLLKNIAKLSDVDLIERTRYDMSFKYFLDLAPEEIKLIDPSLLTKFRRQRLKDVDLLDMLINKTVEIAIEKGIIKKKNDIIVDSTHTNARYNQLSPRQVLINQAKLLRKSVYAVDEKMKEKFPSKKEQTGLLEDQMEYCEDLIKVIENEEILKRFPDIQEKLNMLKEMLDDTNYNLQLSKDEDARIGHKTADTSFFGYKTHIAMTPERIITGAVITSGEKHDGKQLEELIKKSEKSGIEIENIIGDAAYSEKDNLKLSKKKGIKLVAKLSKAITHGYRNKEDEFEYNKDAEMYVCPAGHMAIRKAKQGSKKPKTRKSSTQAEVYYFDVEKCKRCPLKQGCYKENSKTKTFSVNIKDETHIKHMEYMESEEFKELYKERYKIEAKNGELKNNYDYDEANGCGKVGMTIQGASTLFLTNMKRIITLIDEKKASISKNN